MPVLRAVCPSVTLVWWVQLLVFLFEHAPKVFAEVRKGYVETMGRMLHALFKTYQHNLMKV